MTRMSSTLPRAHRPGLTAWRHLILAEMRMVVRDRAGLVVPLGLPLLILVMFGMSAADEPIPELGSGITALDWYVVPLVLVIVVATIGVINMPSFLASYRKTGVLRRLGVTPVHPAMVLVAQVVTSVAQTAVGVTLALTVARVAFDLSTPRHLGAALGVFVLTTAAMYAVGMLIAALSPTTNASVALGLLAFFGMGALGGLFGPPENLPDVLARPGEFLPFGAGIAGLRDAWIGQPVATVHLASLSLVAVVAAAVAAWRFRWD